MHSYSCAIRKLVLAYEYAGPVLPTNYSWIIMLWTPQRDTNKTIICYQYAIAAIDLLSLRYEFAIRVLLLDD